MTTENNQSTKNPVDEQAEIRRILKLKDFYEILQVPKTATEQEIKKSYRKLALKYHPDKNKAEGSKDVFKKVAQAYDCLSNAEKRAFFDSHGMEEQEQRFQTYRNQYYNDIDPNDIFNFFFSGGFPREENNGRHFQHKRGFNGLALLQLLPIFLILFSGTFYTMFQESPVFSLQRTYDFNIRQQTKNLEVTYFVDNAFLQKARADPSYKRKIDSQVEQQYYQEIEGNCYQQKRYEKYLQMQLRQAWSESTKYRINQQIQNIDWSDCQTLQQISSKMSNKYT